MAPHDDLLNSICHSEETLRDAQSILRVAQQKTAPGSGFELGPRRTGLPAICAYIASQRLNNTDVTRHNAQIASCLKASDFEKALFTVEAAIGGGRRERGKKDVYANLMKEYSPAVDRQQFIEWMGAVNRALVQSHEGFALEEGVEGSVVKCAIFFWTYHVVTGKSLMTQHEFAGEQHISTRALSNLLNKITSCGSSIKARIQGTLKSTRSPTTKTLTTPTATPRRSPKKPQRILPSKDSPTKRKVEAGGTSAVAASEQNTADTSFNAGNENADDYGEDGDDDIVLPETPSRKRRRINSVSPAKGVSVRPNSPMTTTAAGFSSLIASPSRVKRSGGAGGYSQPIQEDSGRPQRGGAGEVDGNDDSSMMKVDKDVETVPDQSSRQREDGDEGYSRTHIQRRRFRPVYLDHKQWYALDKRVKRLWKQTGKNREGLNLPQSTTRLIA